MPNDSGVNWDENHPVASDPEGRGCVEILSLRQGARARLGKEHITPDESGVGGEHRNGSAMPYVGSVAPTVRPDGTTPLGSADIGRLWINGTTIKQWTGSSWTTVAGLGANIQVAVIQDIKANNTDGGTFTAGAWQQRTLSTANDPLAILVAFASNQFTLGPGTYRFHIKAPAYQVDHHVVRLNNVTDGTFQMGTVEYAGTGQTIVTSSQAEVLLVITTGNKVFEIDHWCKTTKATSGFGFCNNSFSPTGGVAIYTQVVIEKIA